MIEKEMEPTLTQLRNVTVIENEQAIFETSSAGSPKPTVEWFHGLAHLRPSENIIMEENDNNHRLVLMKCVLEDTGCFTANASNIVGSCSAKAELTVKGLCYRPFMLQL